MVAELGAQTAKVSGNLLDSWRAGEGGWGGGIGWCMSEGMSSHGVG